MKRIHLYEIKLINGQIYRGEIIQRNDKTVWMRLTNKQAIHLSIKGVMLIKDLGWREKKINLE